MNTLHLGLLRFSLLLLLGAGGVLPLAAASSLDGGKLARLARLKPGAQLVLDGFPVGASAAAPIRFERVQIYAGDARVFLVTPAGNRELPRSSRQFFRGYSDDGLARAAIALNADGSFAEGSGAGPDGAFVLRRSGSAGSVAIAAERAQLPEGFKFDFQCGNEGMNLDARALGLPAPAVRSGSSAATTASAHALRFATVAIDTDNPFMLKLFNNDTTSATNWIASLFNTMNLMYERDVLVRLYVGTSYYQTAQSDPYTAMQPNGTAADTMSVNLDIFSLYWKTNHPAGSPTRAFAALLSGLLPSTMNSCSASGIAWLNNYCAVGTTFGSGHTAGSYSVNQVCTSTNPAFGPAFTALLLAHELGHNFGAYHTHCTDASTGAAPVGTNTVDTCVSGESYVINNVLKNCYSGPTSCPAAGAGTIMSYCNFTDSSGCTSNTQNLLEFAPAHIGVIDTDISLAPAGCLNTTDDVFYSGFDL